MITFGEPVWQEYALPMSRRVTSYCYNKCAGLLFSRVGWKPRLVLRVAREPLPSCLWDSYLPLMIEYSIQRTTIDKIQTRIIDKVLEVKGKDLNARRVMRKYIKNITNRLVPLPSFHILW